MSYDLAIRPGSVSTIDTPPSSGTRSDCAAESLPHAQPQNTALRANPSLVLDPSLGLVVMEFRNNAGAVVNSIPSVRQLEAYRINGLPAANGGRALTRQARASAVQVSAEPVGPRAAGKAAQA